jgi:ribonucleotide monophosphatase NagD (HAD superfamily)
MRIDGLSAIADRFDGFLIDQFGVIHDGQRLYPGALRCLRELHALRKPVVVMTNSGKRAAANRQRLVKMGVPRAHFADAISSGEVAYARLFSSPLWGHGSPPSPSPQRGEGRVRGGSSAADLASPVTPESPSPTPLPTGERNELRIPAANSQGPRVFLIGRRGEDYGFDGISFVADPHDADLILILGSDVPATTLDQYREMFRGLTIPALCCNPDRLMLTPSGLMPAPGAFAALYAEMGGPVTWIGKPYPEIYTSAAALIGNPPRILCVGDSPEHDVAGGHAAGFATLLVEQGVSAGRLLKPADPQPDFVMKDFQW